MAMSDLNSYEKDLLLSLSYLDIPNDMSNSNLNMTELIDAMGDLNKNTVANSTRYEKVKNYLDQNPNSPLHSFKLVGYENHNSKYKSDSENNNYNNTHNNTGDYSGLVAYAFDDGSGNGTIIYRGSEDDGDWNTIADWGSNILAGLGMTITQQTQADAFYKKYSSYFNEITIMGHSKGGNLTSYVYLNNLKDNISAYIMNGQPINWMALTYEQKMALKSENFTFNVIDGDFVSWIGLAPYVDNFIKFKEGAYEGFFDPHQEYNAQYDSNFEHIIEDKPYRNFWGQSLTGGVFLGIVTMISQNSLITELQKIYAYTNLVVDKITEFTTMVYNEMKPVAESVINSLAEGLSKVVNAGKDFAIKIGGFFKDMQKVILSNIREVKSKVAGTLGINERMIVDTARLASYENQLRQIRIRISNINSRIDDLYFKVGLLGIDNILRADILTTGTGKMNSVITSLQKTRSILEANERNLKNKAQNI